MSIAECELVAKAVATQLSAAGLGLTIHYNQNPDIQLKDLQGATFATLRDTGDEPTYICRSIQQHDYAVEICLRRKVASDTSPYVGELKYQLQQIADYYRARRTVATRAETFQREEQLLIRWDELLKDKLVMKASIVLIFRGYREV